LLPCFDDEESEGVRGVNRKATVASLDPIRLSPITTVRRSRVRSEGADAINDRGQPLEDLANVIVVLRSGIEFEVLADDGP
jgi:hypothetical protein